MINFQELEKVAEFKNGELNWLEGRDINAVYVILVGDEYYIGSSHYTYLRIGQHLNELQKGTHHSDKFQKKFDEIKEFEVYSLDRGIKKEYLKVKEREYIKKCLPGLNVLMYQDEDLADLENQEEYQTLKDVLRNLYDLLPLSYISETYFKKSRGWLYQRLHGYKVNGKRCTLKEDEKVLFNSALQDISRKIELTLIKKNRMSLLEELKRTESLQGEELDNALLDIRNTYTSEEDRKVMKEYIEASYASIREELAEVREEIMELSLRKRLGDVYDVLPLSYIAEKYFKRTRSWLYQRLNGYKVNGKVCSFTEEEKATFRMATRDIAQMISSAQFV